jgi:phage tail-like protein
MKQADIAQLLPGIFQRTLHPGGMLAAILELMEAMHAPSEEVLEDVDAFFDPYRAPDAFIPFLASWVDLAWLLTDSRTLGTITNADLPSGAGRLRELIAAAAYLSQWRGTGKGLLRFLETATGLSGFTIDEQVQGAAGQPRPFHIGVRAPKAAEPYRAMIERIIEVEKPAYVTYELVFN